MEAEGEANRPHGRYASSHLHAISCQDDFREQTRSASQRFAVIYKT